MADATEHAPADRRPSQRVTNRLAGRRIGPYELLALLGQGAMGAVYLAEHGETERRVALKVMGSHLLEDEESLRRFELELASLIKLRHPGVIAVHDAGLMQDGRPWYAMDYVEGETLREAQKRGLALEQQLDVLEHMGRALGHAHQQGLVHRDFKPDNVLIDADGVCRLTDFGLARGLERDERLTRSDEILGTPRYMAPEQVSRTLGEVGPWSDTWSLGAVLYEMLTGRTPYMGATAVECFAQLTEGQPIPAPRSLAPDVDPALEALCLRALARVPGQRFPDGDAFAEALAQARARPGGSRLLPLVVSVAGVSLLLCAGAVLWVLVRAPSAPGVVAADPAQRRAAAELAWREQDTVRARRLLADDVEHPERAYVLALAGDAAQVDEAAAQAVPLRERAWIAALAGNQAACERALVLIPDPALARATAWQLRALSPGLQPERGARDGLPGPGGWESQARGEELLAEGHPGLAAAAFGAAERGAATDSLLRLNARLGQARAALAGGDLNAALAATDEALRALEASSTASPLERARVLGWEALLRGAEAAGGREEGRGGRASLDTLRRYCPGAPEAAWALWLADDPDSAPAPGGGPLERARALARERRLAEAWQALGGGEGSFARGELAACARGLGGEVGLLLARGAGLAGLAEVGNAPEGARRAAALLELALRLRPDSPAAWLSVVRAQLVLRDVPAARQALERARGLAPGDPWVHLLEGQLTLAELEARRRELDLRRIEGDPDEAGEVALVASLARPLQAYQDAMFGAGPALGWEARLRANTVRLERWTLLERAGEEGAEAEREALARDLIEVAGLGSGQVAQAREALAAALLRASGPGLKPGASDPGVEGGAAGQGVEGGASSSSQCEQALRKAVGQVSPARLQALELLSASGDEQADALLLAAGRDLPGRALLALRRAQSLPGLEQGRWLAHARDLAPALPAVALAWERHAGAGRDEGSYKALAGVLERAPELTSAVLDLLQREAIPSAGAGLAGALESQGEHLAAALAWRVASRASDGPEAAHRMWLAASARLSDPERPCPAAHLLRALAFDPCPEELSGQRRDDLLAARAGTPWEWTATLQRLKTLEAGSDPALRRARLDELLERGVLSPPSSIEMSAELRDALGRFSSAEAPEQVFSLAMRLQQAQLGRAALAVGLCALSPQERVWGLEPTTIDPVLELLPPERAAAAQLLRREERGGRGFWDGGRRGAWERRLRAVAAQARRALERSAPAGLLPLLGAEQVQAQAAWVHMNLPGTPTQPAVWDQARRLGSAPTLLALVERALDEEGRACRLGLQDAALQGEELERCLQDQEESEAVLAWSAMLAFGCEPDLALSGPRLGREYLPSRGGWWEADPDRQGMVALAYRVLAASRAQDDLPASQALHALLADLALEVGAALPASDPEAVLWLERAGEHARSTTPGEVPGEGKALSLWRIARARVGLGDEDGAAEALRTAFEVAVGGELGQIGERLRENRSDRLDRRLYELPGSREGMQKLMLRMGERWLQGGGRRGR